MSLFKSVMEVVRPSHYKSSGGLEVIDVINAFGLDKSFNLGNVVKYVLRSGKKGSAYHDLSKAMWYLSLELEKAREAHKDQD